KGFKTPEVLGEPVWFIDLGKSYSRGASNRVLLPVAKRKQLESLRIVLQDHLNHHSMPAAQAALTRAQGRSLDKEPRENLRISGFGDFQVDVARILMTIEKHDLSVDQIWALLPGRLA